MSVNKTRRIGISFDPEELKKVSETESSGSAKAADDSVYIAGENAFQRISSGSGVKLFVQLTPEEEEGIENDLGPLASAIALYNTQAPDETQGIPMNKFVCFYAELEELRGSRNRVRS